MEKLANNSVQTQQTNLCMAHTKKSCKAYSMYVRVDSLKYIEKQNDRLTYNHTSKDAVIAAFHSSLQSAFLSVSSLVRREVNNGVVRESVMLQRIQYLAHGPVQHHHLVTIGTVCALTPVNQPLTDM